MRYDVITFDCYGTLIDWERGIRDAFRRAAAEDGIMIDEEDVIRTYSGTEAVVENERYRRYRDVLWETAARTAHALGWPIARERAGFLADSLPGWQPFADTDEALKRLRGAGIALGILSNVDNDLLNLTRRHFSADFEFVVTAEQVRSYKPGFAHFEEARKQVGDRRWLHAAQSNYHDIVPANALGIPTAWINRRRQQALPGGDPSLEFDDLAGLAAAVR